MSTDTTTSYATHYISDTRSGRILARCVPDDSVIRRCVEDACKSPRKRATRAAHGGGVNNSYGYPAQTEAILVVAMEIGQEMHCAVYAAQLPANKVTLSGAAAAAYDDDAVRPLFDARYGAAAKAKAAQIVYRAARADIGRKMDPLADSKLRERAARKAPPRARPSLIERAKQIRQAADDYTRNWGDRDFLRHATLGQLARAMRSQYEPDVYAAMCALRNDLRGEVAAAVDALVRRRKAAEEEAYANACTIPAGRVRFNAEGGWEVRL